MTDTAYKENLLNITQSTEVVSENEERLNICWAGLYQYYNDYELNKEQMLPIKRISLKYVITPQYLEMSEKFFQTFYTYVSGIKVKDENVKAIYLLEQWLETPDEYGAEFWGEFRDGLQNNRFQINE